MMIKNNDIHETVNQILLGLNANGMTESSIKTGYRGVYNTFLNLHGACRFQGYPVLPEVNGRNLPGNGRNDGKSLP